MYKFPLEPVLNHRKFIEEERQKELALSEKLLADERDRLFGINNARQKLLKEFEKKRGEDISVSDTLLYLGFIDRLSKDSENQEKRISEVRQICDQKRASLLDAVKKRKVLKKLKEKGSREHRREQLKTEQDFTNEVAITKFNLKKGTCN